MRRALAAALVAALAIGACSSTGDQAADDGGWFCYTPNRDLTDADKPDDCDDRLAPDDPALADAEAGGLVADEAARRDLMIELFTRDGFAPADAACLADGVLGEFSHDEVEALAIGDVSGIAFLNDRLADVSASCAL